MNLEEQKYSVLVVSGSKSFHTVLSPLLDQSAYSPVVTLSDTAAAKRMLTDRTFDFVIVNSPLSDDTGIDLAIDAGTARETVVLLFVKAEIHEDIRRRVVKHGVFTLPKPTSRQTIIQALGWMASTRERLRGIQAKSLSVEEKMAEIRLVNRAKWLLISELHMDEPHAHRHIEKQAMDLCIPKRQVAEDIIKTYS